MPKKGEGESEAKVWGSKVGQWLEYLATGVAWNGIGGFVCCLGILEPFPQSFLLDFLFGGRGSQA